MSEKHLTELPWKALVAKNKIKDPGLQKALIAYAKVDAIKNPALAIESLAEVSEQAAKLKKANSAIKEVAAYLDEVVKEVKRTTQALEAVAKPEKEADEQENEDIKVRLTNALKKVKAAEGNASFAFVACVAKPCYGLLLAKSATEKIGAAHKKVLTGLTSGTKFIVGSCLFENNGHTFVVDQVSADLAKNLRNALKRLTGMWYKVRVRDPEGKTVADADNDTDAAPVPPAAPPKPQATPAEAEPAAAAKGPAPSAATPPNKELDTVNAELDATQQLIDALKDHVQNAQIPTEIAAAEAELTKARDFATVGKFKEARAALAQVKKECAAGKKVADQYAEYVKKQAEAAALIHSFRGFSKMEKRLVDMDKRVSDAAALAAAPKRDYVKATALVASIRKDLADELKSLYVDNPKADIKRLKAKSASSLMTEDIKEIDELQAEIVSDLANGAWRKVMLSGRRLNELVGIAIRVADRRGAFDTQRAATRKAIDELKKHAVFAAQAAEMEKLLTQADETAGPKTMRIEDAVVELKKIQTDCMELLAHAKDATAYDAERKAAEKKLAALSSHPAAASLKEVLPGIQQQLEGAAAHEKNQDWKGARAVIAQVTVDLAAAAKLADNAKDLQAAASGKGDAAAVKKAVEKLRNQADALAKGQDADLLKAELTKVADSLAEAETLAAATPPGDATGPLKAAADLLVTMESAQGQHDRFVKLRKTIEDRQKALLKLPTAGANKVKIDAVGKALAEADTQDKARDWPKLTAAISAAQEAATEAEKMAGLRKEFDARTKKIADRLQDAVKRKAVDAGQEKDIQDDLTSADKDAAAFQFDNSKRSLDSAENRFEAIAVNNLASKTPPDTALIAATAKKMMAKGGASQIDALVQQLPDTVPHAVLQTLAKERFGVTFTDDGSDAATATKTGKKLWEMMAKVPDDVVGNPSLKKVERQAPNNKGGYYKGSDELVVMYGRPGQSAQGFGANIASELPADVEDDCKPVNDDAIDLLDYAMLHEVGHSVDDNLQFMEAHGKEEPFGKWTIYGGKVDAIAAAVATWAVYDSTPEQNKYVLDVVLGNEPTVPVPPPDKQAEWDAARQKVDDWYAGANTNAKPWDSQSGTDKITIGGLVYQEAYKRNWVSYAAKARKQGIMGYQFRAPGEWFAELYASYKSEKLKASHPAAKWLSTLDI